MTARLLLSGGLLLALLGCAPGPDASAPSGEPAPDLLPELREDGVRASMVAVEAGVMALRLDARAVSLGSVQGRVRFDPSVLHVSAVEPVSGGFTVANGDSLARGLVRFAAFSPGPLATGELLRLRVALAGPLAAAGVQVNLEAAGTAEGESIRPALLRATRGVFRVLP